MPVHPDLYSVCSAPGGPGGPSVFAVAADRTSSAPEQPHPTVPKPARRGLAIVDPLSRSEIRLPVGSSLSGGLSVQLCLCLCRFAPELSPAGDRRRVIVVSSDSNASGEGEKKAGKAAAEHKEATAALAKPQSASSASVRPAATQPPLDKTLRFSPTSKTGMRVVRLLT